MGSGKRLDGKFYSDGVLIGEIENMVDVTISSFVTEDAYVGMGEVFHGMVNSTLEFSFNPNTKVTTPAHLDTIDSKIKDVIFNPPATVILWKDGSKTVVKTQDGEAFDPEKGFTMAIMKYLAGNKSNFNNVVKKWMPEVDTTVMEEEIKKAVNVDDFQLNDMVTIIEVEESDVLAGFREGMVGYVSDTKYSGMPEVRFPIHNCPTKKRFFHSHQLRRV